jgi:branched-chain amino acid aminotransferase
LGEFKVSQKPFKIQELCKAVDENRLYEAFGCGTAASVSPINSFNYNDRTYKVPIDEETSAGPLTHRMLKMVTDIQGGLVDKPDWQFVI